MRTSRGTKNRFALVVWQFLADVHQSRSRRSLPTLVLILAVVASCRSAVAQQAPIGATGGASVTIQLPTVSVVSVQTTVSAPDGGTAMLGGLSRSAAFRNHAFSQPPAVAHSHSNAQMVSKATIIDFREIEDHVGLRVARQLVERGEIAKAIDQLQHLQASSGLEDVQAVCQANLNALQRHGAAELDALLSGEPSLQAIDQASHILEQYAVLIDSPRRRQLLRAWQQLPEFVEHTHGGVAEAYFQRGRKAESEGKSQVAAVYYRMAAQHPTTTAGKQASDALGRLALSSEENGRPAYTALPPKRQSAAKKTTGPHTAQVQPDYARLAELYRGLDPEKSADYLRRANRTMPTTKAEPSIRLSAHMAAQDRN